MRISAPYMSVPLASLIFASILIGPAWARDAQEISQTERPTEVQISPIASVAAVKPTQLAESKAVKAQVSSVESQEKELHREIETKVTTVKQKLAGTQLQQCQAHQSAIQQQLQNVSRLTATQASAFNSIATRVEGFKAAKNISVPDYQAKVNEVNAAQANVQAALGVVQDIAKNFSCTNDGPKNQLEQFKAAVSRLRSALKAYRLAVRELIVTIRQANGQHIEATPSATPIASSAATLGAPRE